MTMMLSKYAWHPPHRPPPAEPSIAGRIAMIGPIGKCLETALDELLTHDNDDQAVNDAKHNNNCGDGISINFDEPKKGDTTSREGKSSSSERPTKRRKHCPESIMVTDGQECVAGDGTADAEENKHYDVSESISCKNPIRLDETVSRSILEAYGKSVAETNYDDHERKAIISCSATATSKSSNNVHVLSSHNNNPTTSAAPAALLTGEIDHFNRIGGQWRIVVKNAVLKRRSLTKVDNGLTGRSLRKRTVLDWDDDDDHANVVQKSASEDGNHQKLESDRNDVRSGNGNNNPPDVHHFQGTIQILAYDDDT